MSIFSSVEASLDVERQVAKLDRMLPPRNLAAKKAFRPQPGPQTKFLTTKADIAIYGGAAGGGKTWGLLVENLKHIHNGRFGAVLFRRTYPQITNEGGMWDESNTIFPYAGGNPRVGDLDWTWPSGAKVSFRHLMYEKELLDWMGAQIPYIGWDQLEHFTERQFWYMFSRNRSMSGIKPFVRATVNPDADSWVADLIAWWIDQDTGFPIYSRSGVIRWFIRLGDDLVWGDSDQELYEKYGDPTLPRNHPEQVQPKTLTFIPARVTDNMELLRADPGYIANLRALGDVDRQRLLEGNWKVKYEAGKIFNRNWFEIIYTVPDGPRRYCRGWDLAATEKELKGDDPDYTASCYMSVGQAGDYIIHETTAEQVSPTDGDRAMKRKAKKDGRQCLVRWEEEPGASGKRDSATIIKFLAPLADDLKGIRPKGDKYQRSKGLATQAREKNVKLLHGDWNKRWLAHMHGQPDLPHDDEHDAASVAYNGLTIRDFTLPRSLTKRLFRRGRK